jgi:hypothetical protein
MVALGHHVAADQTTGAAPKLASRTFDAREARFGMVVLFACGESVRHVTALPFRTTAVACAGSAGLETTWLGPAGGSQAVPRRVSDQVRVEFLSVDQHRPPTPWAYSWASAVGK